jgi:hypothetical protein
MPASRPRTSISLWSWSIITCRSHLKLIPHLLSPWFWTIDGLRSFHPYFGFINVLRAAKSVGVATGTHICRQTVTAHGRILKYDQARFERLFRHRTCRARQRARRILRNGHGIDAKRELKPIVDVPGLSLIEIRAGTGSATTRSLFRAGDGLHAGQRVWLAGQESRAGQGPYRNRISILKPLSGVDLLVLGLFSGSAMLPFMRSKAAADGPF